MNYVVYFGDSKDGDLSHWNCKDSLIEAIRVYEECKMYNFRYVAIKSGYKTIRQYIRHDGGPEQKGEDMDKEDSLGISFNQQVKADAGKLKLSLVPREIIRAIARARMYGLKKYGDKESWKSVSKERYIDALYRHFLAYLDDIGGVDEESGLLHTDHMAFNIAAICELEKKERENE